MIVQIKEMNITETILIKTRVRIAEFQHFIKIQYRGNEQTIPTTDCQKVWLRCSTSICTYQRVNETRLINETKDQKLICKAQNRYEGFLEINLFIRRNGLSDIFSPKSYDVILPLPPQMVE